jgi:hypothetical protein
MSSQALGYRLQAIKIPYAVILYLSANVAGITQPWMLIHWSLSNAPHAIVVVEPMVAFLTESVRISNHFAMASMDSLHLSNLMLVGVLFMDSPDRDRLAAWLP